VDLSTVSFAVGAHYDESCEYSNVCNPYTGQFPIKSLKESVLANGNYYKETQKLAVVGNFLARIRSAYPGYGVNFLGLILDPNFLTFPSVSSVFLGYGFV